MGDIIKEMLRVIAGAMQVPTIIILLILIGVAVVSLGSLLGEMITERLRMKEKIPELIDSIQGKTTAEVAILIENSGLLKRQKKALAALISRDKLPQDTRDALARQLLFDEQNYYEKVTKVTDIIARLAPMFGLLGTLIPLGPGLIALGQGDTKTLSSSLLIAFDTTVAGLISGAVAFLVSSIRKRWYEGYLVSLETIMESILDKQNLK